MSCAGGVRNALLIIRYSHEVSAMSIHEDEAPRLSPRMWRHKSKAALHALGNHSLEEVDSGLLDRELDRAEANSGESMRSIAHHTKPRKNK